MALRYIHLSRLQHLCRPARPREGEAISEEAGLSEGLAGFRIIRPLRAPDTSFDLE